MMKAQWGQKPVVLKRTIEQLSGTVWEHKLRQPDSSIEELLQWEQRIQSSRLKTFNNIEEVYTCTEETTEGVVVTIFFQAKREAQLPNFRAVQGLGFLLPVGGLANELVAFLNGALK